MNVDYEVYSREYLEFSEEDDDRTRKVKEVLNTLPLAERVIIVMYMEFGTYSEVSKHLHCSIPTCSSKIKKIKKKILECI